MDQQWNHTIDKRNILVWWEWMDWTSRRYRCPYHKNSKRDCFEMEINQENNDWWYWKNKERD
jgi:hypothetical protein